MKRKMMAGLAFALLLVLSLSAGLAKSIVVLDTDLGTDDAAAVLAAAYLPEIHVDYMVATQGNTTQENALRNAVLLKKVWDMDAVVVEGLRPEDAPTDINNTFHGTDGLAGDADEMMKTLGVTEEDLSDYIPFDRFEEILAGCDDITYIVVGPTTNLAHLIDNKAVTSRISCVLVMGGGIREFNSPHNTEFNFRADPDSVRKVFESGLPLVLVPLDLTNHQVVISEEIDSLEAAGANPYYIDFLRYNLQSNHEFNQIDAAVMHDTMPVLYLAKPEEYTAEEMRISIDEYGATIVDDENGVPVRVVMSVEPTLLHELLRDALSGK